MSLRTPLGKALGLGSAKDGTGHWWSQRVTAAALAILGLWFAIALASLDGFDFQTVRLWLGAPLNSADYSGGDSFLPFEPWRSGGNRGLRP